ncbi:MAG TPA: DUF4097 family beta strand repeat-containing protein [Kofleriaceae bacterium]|nr:DUF4097 family beta strand repeat-containing protein [Kofleriaceae bacterium]
MIASVLCAGAAIAHADPKPAAPPDGVFERDQVEVGPSRKPIRTITIENALGDVRVEGHDGKTVQIIATKRAPDDDTLDRLRVSLVPDPDGAVKIVTAVDGGREAKPVARSAVRIDVVIRAPRDAKVDARVHDGKLELFNMDAGGELDALDGNIAVENVAGAVVAHSLAGDQTFKSVFGTVDAQAITADMVLDTVRGERLIASVHAGKIDGRHVTSRHIELRTTRGDIVFDGTATAGGDIVVASLRGDVSVTLHGGVPVRVHASAAHVTLPSGGRADEHDPSITEFGEFGLQSHPTPLTIQSRFGTVSFALAQ